MIKESILITTNIKGKPHIVPMGIQYIGKKIIVAPFIPSQTYNNLLEKSFCKKSYRLSQSTCTKVNQLYANLLK